MRKLFAKDLKIKFIETLNELDEFSYEEGNPFLIKIGTDKYFVFLKNLSPAYFKNSPDITRVQLPYSNRFEKILCDNIPFIILGYDIDTDSMVSWNPSKVRNRLNAKSNVSLYSRLSLQKQVKEDEYKTSYLSNGEKIVVFKRSFLAMFFAKHGEFFVENENLTTITSKNATNEPEYNFNPDMLYELTDLSLLKKIKPLLKRNQVLHAVEVTSKYYSGKYLKMTFRDWYKLVTEFYRNNDLN